MKEKISKKQMGRREFISKASKGAAAVAAITGFPYVSFGATKKVRIFWIPGHLYKAYDAAAKEVEKKFDCQFQLEVMEFAEMRSKFMAAIAAGRDAPDLIEEDFMTDEFAPQGYLHPLTEFIKKDGKEMGYPDDWQPYAINRQTVDGVHYGIQLHLTNLCLYYNRELFKANGIKEPPTNWAEFLETAQKCTKRVGDRTETWGYVLHYQQRFAWPWFYQNEATWYDPATKKVLTDSKESVEAFQFLQDLIHKYKVAPPPAVEIGSSGPPKLFIPGRAAMITSGPWDIKPIKDGNPKLDWFITVMPKGKRQATTGYGTGMFIPKLAQEKELAWELMKKWTSLDVEIAVTKEANMCMPRKTWAKHPEVQKTELIKPFAESMPISIDYNAEIRRTHKSEIYTTLWQKTFDDIVFNKKTAKEALQEYTERANAILKG
jgi:multiple sugar transport system substrate-binding protein